MAALRAFLAFRALLTRVAAFVSLAALDLAAGAFGVTFFSAILIHLPRSRW